MAEDQTYLKDWARALKRSRVTRRELEALHRQHREIAADASLPKTDRNLARKRACALSKLFTKTVDER